MKELFVGQVSLEMLIIIAFLFIALIPLIFYIYNIIAESAWKIDVQQAQSVVVKIIEYSDKLALGGENSTAEVMLYFPSKVKNFTTSGRRVSVSVDIPLLGTVDQVALAKQSIVQLGDWEGISGMQRIHFNYSRGVVYIYR